MPRKPRFNLIGVPQHVIQRGNNREPCFFAEDDYDRYLKDLISASKKYGCRVHAYALMVDFCSCKIYIHHVPVNNQSCSSADNTDGRTRHTAVYAGTWQTLCPIHQSQLQ